MSDEQIQNISFKVIVMKKDVALKETENIKNQLVRKYKPEEVEERIALGDPFVNKIFKKGKILYG